MSPFDVTPSILQHGSDISLEAGPGRPGNAESNTANDHIAVIKQASTQRPGTGPAHGRAERCRVHPPARAVAGDAASVVLDGVRAGRQLPDLLHHIKEAVRDGANDPTESVRSNSATHRPSMPDYTTTASRHPSVADRTEVR